jgi:hypothetical protein
MSDINAAPAVPKRILGSLLASVSAGVVPRAGAPYIAIGRKDEIAAILSDLEAVSGHLVEHEVTLLLDIYHRDAGDRSPVGFLTPAPRVERGPVDHDGVASDLGDHGIELAAIRILLIQAGSHAR